jgi:hypothetical protein
VFGGDEVTGGAVVTGAGVVAGRVGTGVVGGLVMAVGGATDVVGGEASLRWLVERQPVVATAAKVNTATTAITGFLMLLPLLFLQMP